MAGKHTIVKGDTFSGIEKEYNLPRGAIAKVNPGVNPNRLQIGSVINMPSIPEPVISAPTPQRLPVDLIRYSQAIAHAETGGERNPYIRTRFGNSTAYGPQQMTETLVRDYYNRDPNIRREHGDFIRNKLFPMYAMFKRYGRQPNRPGYQRRFDYGGEGFPLNDDEKLQYASLAMAIMREQLKRSVRAGNASTEAALLDGIRRWRGVPRAQDPQYYNRVTSFYSGGQQQNPQSIN